MLDDAAHVVVGVLPPDFKYPSAADAWVPRPPQPYDDDLRARAQMPGVARLVPGTTAAEAQAELDRIAVNLAGVHPGSNANTGFRVIHLRQHILGDVEPPLMLLLGAVGLRAPDRHRQRRGPAAGSRSREITRVRVAAGPGGQLAAHPPPRLHREPPPRECGRPVGDRPRVPRCGSHPDACTGPSSAHR